MYLNQLSYNDGEAIRRDALRRCRVSAVNGQSAVGPRGAWRGESESRNGSAMPAACGALPSTAPRGATARGKPVLALPRGT